MQQVENSIQKKIKNSIQKNKNQHTKKKAYVGKKTITAKLFFGKNF